MPRKSGTMLSVNTFLVTLRNKKIPTIKDNKDVVWLNIPAAFDIETTSFYDKGIVDPDNKRAIMYIWQFGIDNIVTYGRTWEEFQMFLVELAAELQLTESRRLVIYVHNLAYEFGFMRKLFNWDSVFLLEERKPVKCRVGGLEFRCSLKLSGGRSLAKIGEELVSHESRKQLGALDYELLRSPETPLTDEEMSYCEYDIRVLLDYIAEKIEQDGNITRIPLTNTGYVRNYCRKACYSRWRKYRDLMDALTMDADEFSQLRLAFTGGHTHANASYVQKVLQNVGSYDINSSYPSVMCLNRFPMSKVHVEEGRLSDERFAELLSTKACLFRLAA